MHGSKRCILLAGAPHEEALKWDEQGLVSHLQPPIQRFLGKQNFAITQSIPPTPSGLCAKWRSVVFDEFGREKSGLSTVAARTKSAISHSTSNVNEHLEDFEFLEHSIAVLDNLESSQIISTAVEVERGDCTDLQTTDLSFTTSLTDNSIQTSNGSFALVSPSQDEGNAAIVKIPGGITDLKRLPTVDHITGIRPQTITVNLLVGIIAVSPPCTVRLRRRDIDMDITKLTVGDETRAGFSISFWLVPVERRKPSDDLRETLLRLRSGQVVFLQNVALSCWKGTTSGQTLSKRFARNSTTITVLEDTSRQSLPTPVSSKLRRVQDWAVDFVGLGKRCGSFEGTGNGVKKRKVDELPPDTQD